MNDLVWQRLLNQMSLGKVVPVVGSRLLVDAQGVPLSSRIAKVVVEAAKLEIDTTTLPPFREINEIVTRLKKAKGADANTLQVEDLYGYVHAALGQLEKEGCEVPRPLRQLAAITSFRLMVTVTPDDMLARALAEAGRGVDEVIHAPQMETGQAKDLPDDWQKREGVVPLLYLFGKAAWPAPFFAIHDEDVLELAHNVIVDGSNAPQKFLGALRDRSLLIVGCNFPDWLSRLFLRASRKSRLSDVKGSGEWLVEGLGKEDPFVGFLDNKYEPSLTNVDPVQFVDELYRRWVAEQKPAAAGNGKAGDAGDGTGTRAAPPTTSPDGRMFFISYSRPTDQTRARAVKAFLVERLKVAEDEIWFDSDTLEVGNDYRKRILDGISGCRYFVPLISSAGTRREEAFFFEEWERATERLKQMNRTYLVPLVVDPEYAPGAYKAQKWVANWLERSLNFAHAPEGRIDESTFKALQALVRAARDHGRGA